MQFYASPSTNLWEDEEGVNQETPQGEAGEQGDPFTSSAAQNASVTCTRHSTMICGDIPGSKFTRERRSSGTQME